MPLAALLLSNSLTVRTWILKLLLPHPQARDRILGLKGQILRNDETLGRLMAMATAGR